MNASTELNNFQKMLIAARYWLLGMAQHDGEYFNVLEALVFGLEHHDGKRNGGEPEFIHQLEIFHHVRTLHRHLKNPKLVYKLIFCMMPLRILTNALENSSLSKKYEKNSVKKLQSR